jgi:hypothetical protein
VDGSGCRREEGDREGGLTGGGGQWEAPVFEEGRSLTGRRFGCCAAAVLQGSPDDGNKQDMRGSSLWSSGRCRLHLEVLRCGESTGSTPAAAALDATPAQAARRTGGLPASAGARARRG